MTAQEESEITEAFSLFAEPMEGEKYGVMPTSDVRSAMMYVGGGALPGSLGKGHLLSLFLFLSLSHTHKHQNILTSIPTPNSRQTQS